MQLSEAATMGMHIPGSLLQTRNTNMKYEDVIALAKAGFTSQQIAQFAEEERHTAAMSPAAPAAISPSEAPAAAPEMPEGPSEIPQAPAAPAAPQTFPAPSVNKTDEILMGITQELASLKKAMQSKNLQSTNQPMRESTEAILASIISPTYTHKEE